MEVLQGNEAEKVLTKILNDKDKAVENKEDTFDSGKYPKPFVSGYYQEEKPTCKLIWTAFDNTNGYCWVEGFETEQEAANYANGNDEE